MFFSLGWLQKMSVGRWALWAWCRGNITAVSWCVFIVTLIPQGETPFTSAMPAASFWQEVLKHTVHFTKEIQKAQVWVRIKIYVMLYTHTQSPPAAGAGLSTASPVHPGIASLLCRPHLFYSQGQGDPLYDGTPFITAGAITGDVSLSENFKPILPPHLSLSLSSFSLCVSFLFGSCRLLFRPSSSVPLYAAPRQRCCRSGSH